MPCRRCASCAGCPVHLLPASKPATGEHRALAQRFRAARQIDTRTVPPGVTLTLGLFREHEVAGAIDRVLDMIRTVPNNTSDLAVATVVARWENEIDVEIYKSSKDV